MPPKSILVVDDDDIWRTRLVRAFSDRGYAAMSASDADQAMDIIRNSAPNMAVLDLKMKGRSGLELLQEIKTEAAEVEIVLLTGYGSITNAVEAIRLGAINYVSKPADADQILAAFQQTPPQGEEKKTPSYNPPSLAELEWEHIQRVLADCGGNVSEAARLLEISRRTLQRKLKKLSPKW